MVTDTTYLIIYTDSVSWKKNQCFFSQTGQVFWTRSLQLQFTLSKNITGTLISVPLARSNKPFYHPFINNFFRSRVVLFKCHFQQYFSYIVAVSFIGGGKPEKTPNLSQVTDKLHHIMLYTSPWSRFELTTLVVIGTVCTGSCKSN